MFSLYQKGLTLVVLFLFSAFLLKAQDTARVQVVHNAADPLAEMVDVYLAIGGDTILPEPLNDFTYRTATPFLTLPAGEAFQVIIAPGSSASADEGIATFEFTLNADSTYYLVANGVVDTGFAPNPGELDISFNLFPFEGAREAGVTDSLVDVNVFHGATDAPTVGVDANGATIIPGFSYGDFSAYLSVPPAPYQLDVTVGGEVLVSFDADLSAAAGASALVLASGFVDPASNNDGEGFGLLAVFADGSTALLPVSEVEEPSGFTLQILHANDLEGGKDAIENAPNFAAIVQSLEGEYDNTLVLSGGDNYIPGPFFNAAGDRSLRSVFQDIYQTLFEEPGLTNIREAPGRADITIMNIIGFDASAVGNHEFDAGTDAYADIIGTDIRGPGLGDTRWLGAQFPYLSANLDFSGDGSLSGLDTTDILDNTAFQSTPDDLTAAGAAPKLAPATTIMRSGEMIGVVGATTQLLETITSSGGVTEISSPGVDDMPALAAVIQPVIDGFTEAGIDKVILVSHLQNIDNEKTLVTLLSGIDVVVAGGSDVLMAQDDDILRPGDSPAEPYPFVTAGADGNPTVVLGTDGEYTYVGRLVVEFDSVGVIDTASLANAINGAYATDADGVGRVWGEEDPFMEGSKGELTSRLTDAISEFVARLDSINVGRTDVFIEGRRQFVRTEETNLGSLTADANLVLAQSYDSTVVISLKNGGGIRAAIGTTDSVGNLLPPQANPEVGKEEGDISALDVVNSLRFNNGLSLLTLTAEELQQVIEYSFSASSPDPGNQQGRFPQFGGLSVLVDYSKPGGSRVGRAVLIDEEGNETGTIIENGLLVVPADSNFRIVTLDFLAGGGDGYPYDEFPNTNQVDLEDVLTEAGNFTFADPGSEQDALAEYLNENFSETPFDKAETPAEEDTRIQFGTFEFPPAAFVQVVHNAADPAAEMVDVYVFVGSDTTNAVKIDDFTFRTATPFLRLPSDTTLTVGIAGPDSEGAGESIAFFDYVLADSSSYYLVANGVLDTAFAANPDGLDIAFNLFPFEGARTMGSSDSLFDAIAFHGSTDAPAVGINANGTTIVNEVAYGGFTGFVSVDPIEYILDITLANQPEAVVASFEINTTNFAGAAGLLVASGFLTPDANNDGPSFGLLAVNPDGSTLFFEPVPPAAGLQVLDGDNGVVVENLMDGDTIDLAETGNIPLNVMAMPVSEAVGSVTFDLAGPLAVSRTENVMPFFLFGDNPEDSTSNFARELPMGSYMLSIAVYAESNGGGEVLEETMVGFEVINSEAPMATAFDVLDADNNILIEGLEEGAVINLAELGNVPLNFQANFDEEQGSVLMELEGPLSMVMRENFAPYTLFGDDPAGNRNYAQELPVGSYTLTATPFDMPNTKGTAGNPLTVNFSVVAGLDSLVQQGEARVSAMEGEFRIFPNPSNGRINFQLNNPYEGRMDVFILHSSGSVVRQFTFGKLKGAFNETIDLSNLPNGVYFMRTMVNGNAQHQRFMIAK